MPVISRDKLVIGQRYLIVSDKNPNQYRFGTWSTTPANPEFEIPEKGEFSDIKEYTIIFREHPPTDFPGMDRTYSFLEGNESLEVILKGGIPLKGGARKRHKRRTVRKRV
jgi:hypothetical protein